jgi:hypothetical protein
MTISIKLFKRPYSNLEERTQSKVKLAYDIFNFYSRYFDPAYVEIWLEAPTEVLEGKLLKLIECRDSSHVKDILMQEAWSIVRKEQVFLESMILLLRGVWNINGKKVPGYICVNNEDLSIKTYGDIEVGVYQREEIRDIIDLFWTDTAKVQSLVNDFMSQISKFQDKSYLTSQIVFGVGVPLIQPVTEWKASYHRIPSYFVSKVLLTMKEYKSDISSYLRLININAIAAAIYNIADFQEKVKKIASKNDVEVDTRKSLKLVGIKIESYKNMINELISFLTPVLQKSLLPDRKIIDNLANQIAGQLTLD